MRRAEGLRRWGGWRGRHGWHERRTARLLVGLGRPGCGQPDQQQKKGTRARTPAPTPRPCRRNVGLGRKCLRQHASCAPHNSRWADQWAKRWLHCTHRCSRGQFSPRAELVASTPSSPRAPHHPVPDRPSRPRESGLFFGAGCVAHLARAGSARLRCASSSDVMSPLARKSHGSWCWLPADSTKPTAAGGSAASTGLLER